MNLNEIIADLDTFLESNDKVVAVETKSNDDDVVSTDVSSGIVREMIGVVLGSVDENVEVDVLAQKLFEASMVITEDDADSDIIFDKSISFFESVAKAGRDIQSIDVKGIIEGDDDDDDDDDADDDHDGK